MFKDSLDGVLGLLAAAFSGFAWLIRLEVRTAQNEKTLSRLEQRHEDLENKIIDKLSIIEKSLSNIEGRLSVDK